jgi:hypothetical protein
MAASHPVAFPPYYLSLSEAKRGLQAYWVTMSTSHPQYFMLARRLCM